MRILAISSEFGLNSVKNSHLWGQKFIMIISKTPFRISFVGGGSDLREFYQLHQGAVLSTSINQYMYISTHPFFDRDSIRLKYAQTETVQRVNEIQHPIFRTLIEKYSVGTGIEFSSIADVPAGTGMGSSSSFTVGLIQTIRALKGLAVSKEELAAEACEVEIDILKEPIGKQDQYAAAYGGLNIIRFHSDETVSVEPVKMDKEQKGVLNARLMMFYTGKVRSASEILSEQKSKTGSSKSLDSLIQMTAFVDVMKNSLLSADFDEFGRILHENWMLKQQLASGITDPMINEAYQAALQAGATGGKLLGAGGGGFLLFYCKEEHQEKVKQALRNLRLFDFKFEEEGSKLIYYGNE